MLIYFSGDTMPRPLERKALSFSTTMRNPTRMAGFLFAMLAYENEVLTHDIIMQIIKNVLRLKLYRSRYLNYNTELAYSFENEESVFSNEELELIIENSPQEHKERGFDKGWESRFDTWYKLMSEFGFCYYAKDQPILISQIGKILIESCFDIQNQEPRENIDEALMGSVFLNALRKYEVGNPYKKNLNHNTPFRLLLALLKRLNDNGMSSLNVKEIPILLCWRNNDDEVLFNYILALRDEIFALNHVHFSYSNEFIFEKCLELLESNNAVRFKIGQITGEAVDEYIRKMRITGLISLRGAGRFIDINHNEIEKVDYILSNPISFQGNYLDDTDSNRFAFYEFMSEIDEELIRRPIEEVSSYIKIERLNQLAISYTLEQIENELKTTCLTNRASGDNLLRHIDRPLRFEFLTAIFLCQNFNTLQIIPNYRCDDEGIPIFTASGGVADIVAYDDTTESYIEVSLIRGRNQVTNEMIPIERHLETYINNSNNSKVKFSVFVAPIIHRDTIRFAQFTKYNKNLDIPYYNIDDFIAKVKESLEISELNM